jgi:hypothetical protein
MAVSHQVIRSLSVEKSNIPADESASFAIPVSSGARSAIQSTQELKESVEIPSSERANLLVSIIEDTRKSLFDVFNECIGKEELNNLNVQLAVLGRCAVAQQVRKMGSASLPRDADWNAIVSDLECGEGSVVRHCFQHLSSRLSGLNIDTVSTIANHVSDSALLHDELLRALQDKFVKEIKSNQGTDFGGLLNPILAFAHLFSVQRVDSKGAIGCLFVAANKALFTNNVFNSKVMNPQKLNFLIRALTLLIANHKAPLQKNHIFHFTKNLITMVKSMGRSDLYYNDSFYCLNEYFLRVSVNDREKISTLFNEEEGGVWLSPKTKITIYDEQIKGKGTHEDRVFKALERSLDLRCDPLEKTGETQLISSDGSTRVSREVLVGGTLRVDFLLAQKLSGKNVNIAIEYDGKVYHNLLRIQNDSICHEHLNGDSISKRKFCMNSMFVRGKKLDAYININQIAWEKYKDAAEQDAFLRGVIDEATQRINTRACHIFTECQCSRPNEAQKKADCAVSSSVLPKVLPKEVMESISMKSSGRGGSRDHRVTLGTESVTNGRVFTESGDGQGLTIASGHPFGIQNAMLMPPYVCVPDPSLPYGGVVYQWPAYLPAYAQMPLSPYLPMPEPRYTPFDHVHSPRYVRLCHADEVGGDAGFMQPDIDNTTANGVPLPIKVAPIEPAFTSSKVRVTSKLSATAEPWVDKEAAAAKQTILPHRRME